MEHLVLLHVYYNRKLLGLSYYGLGHRSTIGSSLGNPLVLCFSPITYPHSVVKDLICATKASPPFCASPSYAKSKYEGIFVGMHALV